MSYSVLSSQVSVSGQIKTTDLSLLADEGVKIIVCNRPDNEDPGQPLFSEIEAAAKALGMQAFNIPFSGGDFTQEQAEEFKGILASGDRTHAYCRSGNRSSIIWQAASA